MSDDGYTRAETRPTRPRQTSSPPPDVEIDKTAGAKDAARPPRRNLRSVPVIPVVLVLALLAAGGLFAWLYFFPVPAR